MNTRRFVLTLAGWALGALAGADEIQLRDGQVVDGEVISPPGASVMEIRVSVAGMEAVRRVPREQVVTVRVGQSAAQQRMAAVLARKQQLGTGGSASDWLDLAQAARKAGDPIVWRACLNEVIRRDRRHEPAHVALGYVRYRGIWMRPEENRTAEGRIRFRDQWLSWGERENILATEAKRQAELEAQARQRARDAAVDALVTGGMYPPTTVIPEYRVVYWPGATFQGGSMLSASSMNCSAPTLSVGAVGGNDHLRWGFRWNL